MGVYKCLQVTQLFHHFTKLIVTHTYSRPDYWFLFQRFNNGSLFCCSFAVVVVVCVVLLVMDIVFLWPDVTIQWILFL